MPKQSISTPKGDMADRALPERVASLDARLASLEQAVRELTQELRSERRHLLERLEALERWQAARNAVNQEHQRLGNIRRQLWLAFLSIAITAAFSGSGLIAVAMKLWAGR